MSARRLAVAVAVLAAVAASGVALAARSPVASRQLASLRIDQAAPTTTSTTAPPATFGPTSLALANRTGGTAGRPEAGDTVTVTFSAPVNQSTICSGWTTNQSSRSLSGVTAMIDNDGANNESNDRIVLTGASGCTGVFKLGTVDLGSQAFVTSTGSSAKDVPFAGSTLDVTSTSSATTVRLTLGTPDPGGTNGDLGTVSSARTAVFTPDSGLKSTAGASVAGTASVTAVLL